MLRGAVLNFSILPSRFVGWSSRLACPISAECDPVCHELWISSNRTRSVSWTSCEPLSTESDPCYELCMRFQQKVTHLMNCEPFPTEIDSCLELYVSSNRNRPMSCAVNLFQPKAHVSWTVYAFPTKIICVINCSLRSRVFCFLKIESQCIPNKSA